MSLTYFYLDKLISIWTSFVGKNDITFSVLNTQKNMLDIDRCFSLMCCLKNNYANFIKKNYFLVTSVSVLHLNVVILQFLLFQYQNNVEKSLNCNRMFYNNSTNITAIDKGLDFFHQAFVAILLRGVPGWLAAKDT